MAAGLDLLERADDRVTTTAKDATTAVDSLSQPRAGAVPAAPTVHIEDGGDGFVNAAEQSAVSLSGTYDSSDTSITSIIARIVYATDPGCATIVDTTPTLTVSVDPGVDGGSWTMGPFDLTGFTEGATLCARARAQAGSTNGDLGLSDNTPALDTIAPAPGTLDIQDGDGWVNASEQASGVPATWTGAPGSSTVTLLFRDSTAGVPAGCGPWTLSASGSGALNATCAGNSAQGTITFEGIWKDAAGNASTLATDSTVLDSVAPAAPAVTVDTDPITAANQTAVDVTVTGEAGSVAAVWLVDRLGDVTATQTGPVGSTFTFDATSMRQGTVTGTATLTDPAGNTSAEGIDEALKDTVAVGNITAYTDPINMHNVGTVEVTVNGESGSTVEINVEDSGGTALPTQTVVLASPATVSFDATSLVDGDVTITADFTDPVGNTRTRTRVALKDTVVSAGLVEMIDPNGDGFMNIAEAGNQCCIPANWANADADAISADVWFEDAEGAIPSGCGPWSVGVTGNGNVNAACAASLPQGEFFFRGQWHDDAGNDSAIVSASLIKDTIRPDVTYTSPAAGAAYPPGHTVVIEGMTEPNLSLIFRLDGLTIGTGTSDENGAFSVALSSLTNGSHVFRTIATDPAGNRRGANLTIVIDPLIPIIVDPVPNALEAALVTFRGTGTPDTQVELLEGGSVFGGAEVDSNGQWEVVIAMSDGLHEVCARGIDGETTSQCSPLRSFSVDASRPTISIATPDLELLPEEITGQAAAGDGVDRIIIEYVDAIRGVKLATVSATCTPDCGPAGTSVDWSAPVPDAVRGLVVVQATAYNTVGLASQVATTRIITL